MSYHPGTLFAGWYRPGVVSEVKKADAHEVLRFPARLRGVDVVCSVSSPLPDLTDVEVEVSAATVAAGLKSISKFAGNCRRTLVLSGASSSEERWAAVLASYFGFGLVTETGDVREEVMPAPAGSGDPTPARAEFVRRALEQQP